MKQNFFYKHFTIISLVVLSSTFTFCNAVFSCQNRKNECHLSQWGHWSNCTSSCGGGTSRRFKTLCCKLSYKTIEKCATNCNITTKEYIENVTCGQTCVNGDFRQNSCQCPQRYTGKCCETDACEQGCKFGECKNGKCSCMAFFKGKACQKPEPWFLVATSALGGILVMMVGCCVCRVCCGYGKKVEPLQKQV